MNQLNNLKIAFITLINLIKTRLEWNFKLFLNIWKLTLPEIRLFSILIILSLSVANSNLKAQSSIKTSTLLGGSGVEEAIDAKYLNGKLYFYGITASSGLPVTTGDSYGGGDYDYIVGCYDPTLGTFDWLRYLGGSGSERYLADSGGDVQHVEIEGNNMYIAGVSSSSNFTGGNVPDYPGGRANIISCIDITTGAVNWSTWLGVSNESFARGRRNVVINNGKLYSTHDAQTDTYPVTTGPAFGGGYDMAISCIDTATGAIDWCRYIGGSGTEKNYSGQNLELINGSLVFTVATNSSDFPVTDGSTFVAGAGQGYSFGLVSLEASSGTTNWATHIGPSLDFAVRTEVETDGTNVFVIAHTNDLIFPTTDASVFSNGGKDVFLVSYNVATGIQNYSTLIGPANINNTWIVSTTYDSGSLYIGVRYRETGPSGAFPVTDGSTYKGNGDIALASVDISNGTINWAKYLGGSGSEFPTALKVVNEQLMVLGTSSSADYPITGGFSLSGSSDFVLNILDQATGELCASTLVGGSVFEVATDATFFADGLDIHLFALTRSSDFPVTNQFNSFGGGTNADINLTTISFCPSGYILDNSISPISQTTCINGSAQIIDAQAIEIPSDNLVPLFRDGISEKQPPISADYQWQVADNANGPWTDLPGAVLEDYLPNVGATHKYYRRMATTASNCFCSAEILGYTDVAAVLVNTNIAPIVNAGGANHTCPNTPIIIGGAPTATGGSSPYTYAWDNGATAVSNPTVSVTVSTIFTVTVTDALGCQQIDQAVVLAQGADAGEDAGFCEGSPGVRIGGSPIAGLTGVTYSWTPTTNLSCTDCAQPMASPLVTTDYTLNMTIPLPNGGTCMTSDLVTVNPISPPNTTDFAGSDDVICLGETTDLGFANTEFTLIPFVEVTQTDTAVGFAGSVTNLTDGDFTTGARTLNGAGKTIQIDLGQVYSNISRIEIAAIVTANLLNKRIDISTDGTIWSNVGFLFGSVTNSSLTAIDFPALDVRYLRFRRPFGSSTNDVSELRVYQSNFSYTWAPGNYLSSNNESTTTFVPGNSAYPILNPMTYFLTAEQSGCEFVDTAVVAVINADAGENGCGPRLIGTPDSTPNIEETYSWVKLSGGGTFLGATDQAQVPVSASPNVTTYELTVSYTLGTVTHSCTDIVVVSPCGPCGLEIEVESPAGCPSLLLGNEVTLSADLGGLDSTAFSYAWSVVSGPSGGLSATNTPSVQLTDTNERTYRLTITNNFDPSFSCSVDTLVNSPAWSLPNFTAQDITTCLGDTVSMGNFTVAGYSYEWLPIENLNPSHTVSNPEIAAFIGSNDYIATVTDDLSGCITVDTATVEGRRTLAGAGADWFVCDNGLVELGTAGNFPNQTFSWTPILGTYENGTDQNSQRPQFIAATNLTFYVEITDMISGCMLLDTVDVFVGNNPTITDFPDATICIGEELIIGAEALPGVTYSWAPSPDLSCTDCAQPTVMPSATATYTVTATFPGNCNAVATDEVTITVNDPNFTLNNIIFCPSDGVVALGGDAPVGMTSYSWSPAALVTDASIAAPSSLDPPPSDTTTFKLEIESTNGCTVSAAMQIIPAQSAPIAGNNETICLNEPIMLGSATNETGADISYNWSPTTDLDNATSSNPTFTPTASGIYTFTVSKTNSTLACTSSSEVTINVDDFVLPALSGPVICEGTCVEIGTTLETGATYFWSPITNLSDPNSSNPEVCNLTETIIYTLTAIGANGCVDQTSVSVSVSPVAGISVNVPDVTACLGAGTSSFNPAISPPGSYNYQWSPTTGLSDPYTATPTVSVNNLGTKSYNLKVTDTNTGCSTDDQVNLNVSPFCPDIIEGEFYATITPLSCCQLCETGNFQVLTAYWEEDNVNLVSSNLALGKPVIFNGIPGLGTTNAYRSTDGKFEGDPDIFYDYAFSTDGENNRWDIDLVGFYELETIRIYTKTGCCQGGANNYQVFISNNPFPSNDLQILLNDSSIEQFSIPILSNGTPSVLNNLNIDGRFVRVFMEGTGEMQLVEVEVIGSGNPNSVPYQYTWSDASVGNLPTAECLPAGVYQVTVTDLSTGYQVSKQFEVN